jgi:uncharacterized protein (TIGR03663 family)
VTYPDKIGRAALFAVLALLALAVRIPQLGVRPMHTDEAVNAYITGQLLAGEPFRYDPRDRHGPALQTVTLPVVRAEGARNFSGLTETELRMVPVLIGALTVLLFCAGAELFGLVPALIAAAWFAFAAMPVYYSRYFIQETLFAAATLALILSGLRWWKSNAIAAAALTGLSAALMLSCKETAALHFFAMAVAAATAVLCRLKKFPSLPVLARNAVVATVVFAGVVFALFSWFGKNPQGFSDLLHAVPSLMLRASGQGHEKPFWYYMLLMSRGWSGAIFLLFAGFGIGCTFWGRETAWRQPRLFLAVYALVLAAIYGVIPYKTPWLALNLWLPLAIMAGIGIEWLWKLGTTWPYRLTFCGAAAAIAILVALDTRHRVFIAPAGADNPYAYAHTGEDLLRLEPRIAQLALDRNLQTPRIAVVAADPWPLPWYLRKYPNTGFWQPGQDAGAADFFITTPEAMKHPTVRLKQCRPEFFGLRPGVLVVLWVPEIGTKTE